MKNENTPSCNVDADSLKDNLKKNLYAIDTYANSIETDISNLVDAYSNIENAANEVEELIECIEEWEDWASDAETEYENLIDEKDEEIKSLNNRVKELESENKDLINQVQKLEEKINNIED